ncbi:hypothetical protein FRB97_001052 [Tulasnella sp. 331]|nr:hypothetical protein FRB97_001052 [Tulasnella sp. 331]KAG8871015.1 hypothetical protein FRB98_001121 [Tulasnella sp. 332]
MDARLRRLNKEIADCKKDKISNITIDLVEDNPFHLVGSFPGPEDTPYAGGHFSVVDILKDAWSPVLTLKSTLISLQSLLCSPEPNDPQDAEVAKHYTTSRASFNETARYWTQAYAGGPKSSASSAPVTKDEVAIAGLEKAHVDQFEALGFERSKVIDVLRRLNYRGSNVANISEDRIVEALLK